MQFNRVQFLAMGASSMSSVLFERLPTTKGLCWGIIQLNAPQALNAVDLDMGRLIDVQLDQWQQDERVVGVLMRGAGDKAFSAGGDIRQIYQSMVAQGAEQYRYADAFFASEYAKNYRAHQFTKPFIAWGNGFVMGGGLGLFMGASHRIGTQTLKLAWPEIRIGLFPDVGATWYLSRLPKPIGHWMGLTGSLMNAVDCKALKLIQHCLLHEQYDDLLKALKHYPWQAQAVLDAEALNQLLERMAPQAGLPSSQLEAVSDELAALFLDEQLENIVERMARISSQNPWLQRGIEQCLAGCPASLQLFMVQLQKGSQMTLKQAVQWELTLAYQAVRHPDFREGVRAMVIDKDMTPCWQHKQVSDVPQAWIERLQQAPWSEACHPLRYL